MSDIALVIKNKCFDIDYAEGDFVEDEGLETAVSISLFTDQRVTEEELPQGVLEKRGWWGDMFPEVDQDQIGSKLWTLEREKVTEETLARANEFSREALQWMIEDGVADTVEVSGEYDSSRTLRQKVFIFKGEVETRYSVLWDNQPSIRRI